MKVIESSKIYSGEELENIFFRPIFSGEKSTEEVGFRTMYNVPLPATIGLWLMDSNILRPYQRGWQGSDGSERIYCDIDMHRVKAESAFAASDYFTHVYEYLVNKADVNMQDLSGTILEQVETELFRAALAEGIRLTSWIGNIDDENCFCTFDGVLKHIHNYATDSETPSFTIDDTPSPDNVIELLDSLWKNSNFILRALRKDNQLAYFVTGDIYEAYEQYLDSKGADSAYRESIDGRERLCYHGIPVVNMGVDHMIKYCKLPTTVAVLADRRNLVLALNTADCPEAEIRLWYNPDQMENRQRAVFLAGTCVIDPNMVSYAYLE